MSQAKYLGVDKDAVIQSLKEGEKFIRSLKIGPATDGILDQFNSAAALPKLAAAQNDKELALAMGETGAPSLLTRMSDVFRHCAALDLEGAAHQLYQDLGEWGAFSGIELADYRKSDYEQDLFMVKGSIAHTKDNPSALDRTLLDGLIEYWKDEQYKDDKAEIDALKLTLVGLLDGDNEGWADELDAAFEAMSLRERHQLKMMVDVVSGMHSKREQVVSKWPLRQFGIKIDSETNNFQEMQTILAPIMDKVGEILTPYYELHEVDMTGVGAITRDFENVGFTVVTSERVAQELADALPDWDVIDGQGNKIMPREPEAKPAPKL